MVRGINIVDARTSPCAVEDDANAVGLNLVEVKDALSFGALSHTAASSSHPCDRASCMVYIGTPASSVMRLANECRPEW